MISSRPDRRKITFDCACNGTPSVKASIGASEPARDEPFYDVRFWPQADIKKLKAADPGGMSANDPKRTYLVDLIRLRMQANCPLLNYPLFNAPTKLNLQENSAAGASASMCRRSILSAIY